MQLSDLLPVILGTEPLANERLNPVVTGLTNDSRQVKSGDLFFAYPGQQVDGRDFIGQALQQGASAILAEQQNYILPLFAEYAHVPIIRVANLASQVGTIAAHFHGHPSRQMSVIGITGTNGKTSCSYFIAQALELLGKKCGIIGTLGNGLYGHLHPTNLTTPDAIKVQQHMAEFVQQGAQYTAMEVTSHSLEQGRVTGVEFAAAVFTNLTRDHLDYHSDMAHYAAAKRKLFAHPKLRYAILNADDAYAKQWLTELSGQLAVWAYALQPVQESELKAIPAVYVYHAELNSHGIKATIHTPWGEALLHNPYLLGRFNLSNLLAVLTVLGVLGIPLPTILNLLAQLRGVPGRMQSFGGGQQPLVVVDFAHTPDALEQVLQVLRECTDKKIWCVFGCGGDRDKGKRPLMGKIAERYADYVVITDDNPRQEDPRQIVADIRQGLAHPEQAVIEHDRRRAIRHAVSCAQSGDIVLIAGKGHETYQLSQGQKTPFNDAVEVQLLLTVQ